MFEANEADMSPKSNYLNISKNDRQAYLRQSNAPIMQASMNMMNKAAMPQKY